MKKIYEKNVKKFKKIDLLEDFKMLLLKYNFVMIYIIHKMLLLLENNLNYLKDSIFECFLRSTIAFFS